MRKLTIVCCFVLIFALTACGSNKEPVEPANGNTNNDGNGGQITEPTNNNEQESYVPEKAVPENLPIYPGAILWNDSISYGDNNWMWLYSTTGSGNEIVEFFTTELLNLGFEIDADSTFAIHEEFGVTTADRAVIVYWLGTSDLEIEEEDVDPDTPGRGYGIIVNFDVWNSR